MQSPDSPGGTISHVLLFQSSPNLSVGCSLHCQVQPVARIDSFQSSPNLSVECSLITAGGVFTPFWFQSSSNLLVGRSLSVSPVLPLFQSSLNLLAGCRWRRSYPLCVSILTQPLGWVQCHNLCQFQSSPNLSAGCSATPVAGSLGRLFLFQSSPNLSAGCSAVSVSILTQPLVWVQRYTGGRIARACSGFNPRPTYRLGAVGVPASLFQSSPNLSSGCRGLCPTRRFNLYQTSTALTAPRDMRFQSSPNLWVGWSSL